MRIEIIRAPSTPQSTSGRLALDGVWECWTLEPAVPIPAGTYPVTLRWSPHIGRIVPHVDGVPGHTDILIHPGNDAHDTRGCVLVGASHLPDWVGDSQLAFGLLMARLQAALGPLTLTVS